MTKKSIYQAAAYGGENWSPRIQSHHAEIGSLWTASGINSEFAKLKTVLLHEPGEEWNDLADPDSIQMLDKVDLDLGRMQHAAMAQAYRDAGVTVHYVEPEQTPTPNQMFCADLFVMTPEGAILGRPASTVRAGEERWVARRLADLRIPIVRTLRGNATFEGADCLWIDPETVLIGRGLRTNAEGAHQVGEAFSAMGVEAIIVDLPIGTMHHMGILRFLDKDLAVAWPYRVSWSAIEALRKRGHEVLFVPDEAEASSGMAFNFVTLGPKEILMAAGHPNSQSYYESLGVKCHTVEIAELAKAAGAIGCLSGIVERERV